MSEDVIDKEVGEFFGGTGGGGWDKMVLFGESIHHYTDGVVRSRRGQAGDEIHGDIVPESTKDRERFEDAKGALSGR